MYRCSGLTPYELKILHSSYKENRSETRFELWEFLFLISKNVYPYQIKTVIIIMAKYKLIFNDAIDDYTMAEIRPSSVNRESYIEQTIDIVLEEGSGHNHDCIVFTMDKSTAIKFAKTLRTEINKITESEVNNG